MNKLKILKILSLTALALWIGVILALFIPTQASAQTEFAIFSVNEFCDFEINWSAVSGFQRDKIITNSSSISYFAGGFPATTSFQGSVTGGVNTQYRTFLETVGTFTFDSSTDVLSGKLVANNAFTTPVPQAMWIRFNIDTLPSLYFEYVQTVTGITPNINTVRCEPQNVSPTFPTGTLSTGFQTRFTDVAVFGASTTVEFDVDYFLDTSEYTATNRPDVIQVLILRDGFFSDQQVALEQRFILPLVTGTSTKIIPIQHTFDDGTYIGYVNFLNVNTNEITFPQALATVEFVISGGVVSSFNIIEISDGTDILNTVQLQECSITNLFGCVVNALTFTFIPSGNVFDSLRDVYTTIENKPPFGYFSATTDILTLSTTTPAFSFGTLPLQDEVFTPLRNGVGAIVIMAYAFFFTSRLFKLNL